MSQLERDVNYLFGEIDGEVSIHAERGYFKANKKHKTTLSVPIDSSNISDILYEQLLQFDVIFAIDSNKMKIDEYEFVGSCAVHVTLEYEGENVWKNGVFTRLPAIISIPTGVNPEPLAWQRLIEYVAPKIEGKIGIVVDSELGDLPFFNSRKLPICHDFYLPSNVQLIYASSERDSASPLNRAMAICDADATNVLKRLSRNFKSKDLVDKISKSPYGTISISLAK